MTATDNLRPMKMILIYLILVIFGILNSVSGAEERDPSSPYCFQFTWLGRTTPATVNCSELETTPCIAPFVITPDQTPPNVTYMWNNLNQTAISCPLVPGYTCIKYTYIYNNAALNISYFCGKMIEDKTTALTSGCYTEKVSGHIIEACACRSGGGGIPCNSSIKTRRSMKMLTVLTMILILILNT